MTTDYTKPLPIPGGSRGATTADFTKPFWEATKRHELVIPRCKTHDGFFFYPRELCPVCLSSDLEWAKVTGRGRVHALTVVYQPNDPRFTDDAPYVYAVIQLDEGARMISNVIGIPPHDVAVDMPVEAVFEDVSEKYTLVKFRPIEE